MPIQFAIVVLAVLIFLVFKCVIFVKEGTVIAEFRIGKYRRSYGTGLHFGYFDKGIATLVTLKLGRVLTATSESTAEIAGFQIPVTYIDTPKIGTPVRIQKFEGTQPHVTHEGVPQTKEISCAKCGHVMTIT